MGFMSGYKTAATARKVCTLHRYNWQQVTVTKEIKFDYQALN